MRILDRYIFREIFRHALLGLIVFTFVFFVPQLVRLMELFVRHTGSGSQIVKLFLCVVPGVLTFTVPMAVLVGVLLGLGRMSSDSEIIALTALGIGRRRILLPVGILALVGATVTLAMTIWLAPLALTSFRAIETDLITSQISFQVQPRVFDERFPHNVLFVNDVSASGTRWHGVFLAETGTENASRLTLAESAVVIAEPRRGTLQLHLAGGTTHEFSRDDPDHYSVTAFGQSDWPINVSGLAVSQPRQPSNQQRTMSELASDRTANWREARVEFHRRLAFPFACFVFALIAVPLGAEPRRGGRAAASLTALLLISGYYLLFIFGAGLSRGASIPPVLGVWAANLVLAAIGFAFLPRMGQFRGESRWLRPFGYAYRWIRVVRRRQAQARIRAEAARSGHSSTFSDRPANFAASFPRLVDLYVLRRFSFYFLLLMVTFVFLFEAFTFFELLDDIARHRVPFLIVVNYFRYLTPYLIYNLAPLGALVAVLVTLGIMSKNNEIIAIKASGISLHRLALPLLAAGVFLAGLMLVVNEFYLPYANQRQDALRNQIKGRPPQTYTQPQRWIFGEDAKIYNYDLFDPAENLFGGLSVLEIDPATFQIHRRIFAERASWSDAARVWVLQGAWVREFTDGAITSFRRSPELTLPELSEPPSYFNREVRQASQMNWRQLQNYIAGLRVAGFDVSNLVVQWWVKIAFPLIAPVSMLLAIPFAFLVGTRGAVSGVAVGIAIGIAYWSISRLMEAMGGVGQLPPFMAAWSPDFIFFFLGLYFYFKIPT